MSITFFSKRVADGRIYGGSRDFQITFAKRCAASTSIDSEIARNNSISVDFDAVNPRNPPFIPNVPLPQRISPPKTVHASAAKIHMRHTLSSFLKRVSVKIFFYLLPQTLFFLFRLVPTDFGHEIFRKRAFLSELHIHHFKIRVNQFSKPLFHHHFGRHQTH